VAYAKQDLATAQTAYANSSHHRRRTALSEFVFVPSFPASIATTSLSAPPSPAAC